MSVVNVAQGAAELWMSLTRGGSIESEEEKIKPSSTAEQETNYAGDDSNSKSLVVLNKVDLLPSDAAATGTEIFDKAFASLPAEGNRHAPAVYSISCTTGKGIEQLEKGIVLAVKDMLSGGESTDSSSATSSESVMITRERHRRHVKVCLGHLDRFLNGLLPMDAAAEELRCAIWTTRFFIYHHHVFFPT